MVPGTIIERFSSILQLVNSYNFETVALNYSVHDILPSSCFSILWINLETWTWCSDPGFLSTTVYTCSDCFGLIPVPVQPDPGLRMFQLTNILWGPSKRKSKIWTNQFISNLISQNLSQMPVSISALCLYALLIVEIWIFLWYLRLLYCFEAHRLKSLSWNFIKILIKIWYI